MSLILTVERTPSKLLLGWILISLVALLFLNRTFYGFAGLSWLMPWLLGMGVFCWVIFKPSYLHLLSVFILGILEDVMTGTPLGFHSFGLVILYFLTQQQRPGLLQQPFTVIWAAFAFNLALTLGSMGFVMWLIDIPFTQWVLIVWVMSAVLFPLVYTILLSTFRMLLV